jgi:hypothetical protein
MSDADALLGRFLAGRALLKLLSEQLGAAEVGKLKTLVVKLLSEAAGERGARGLARTGSHRRSRPPFSHYGSGPGAASSGAEGAAAARVSIEGAAIHVKGVTLLSPK